MLVLTRHVCETIEVTGPCVITLVRLDRNRAALGFEADPSVKILRSELKEKATKPEGSQECGEPRAA